MGKVRKPAYYVTVKAPISFPTLEFARKKDAEAFKALLERSKTLMDFDLQADILRVETTIDGFHL